MPTVLVTGANRGLGLEFVRQYAADGWQVIACCRRPEDAGDLASLASDRLTVEALDVGDEASIAALKARLADQPVDLLVNNAGVYGDQAAQGLGSLEAGEWLRVLRVNVAGPLLVAQALGANLLAGAQRSGGPAVVATVSSTMGSIAENTSGGAYAYRSSKAAVNAAMRSYALDMRGRGVLALVLHPGWVRTDMGGPGGQIDPPESVTGMRAVIAAMTADKSGRFFDYTGKEIPW